MENQSQLDRQQKDAATPCTRNRSTAAATISTFIETGRPLVGVFVLEGYREAPPNLAPSHAMGM